MDIIHIGNNEDFLNLTVHGRVKPEAEDSWDANWLHCTAEASVGKFRGIVDWQLRNEDLTRFLRRLENLDQKGGVALLDTLDGWLDIQFMRDEQGNIKALCQLVDNPVGGNSLEFSLFLNQGVFTELSGQFRMVLDKYPFIG